MIAVQLYSVHEHLYDEPSTGRALERIRAIGYENVELVPVDAVAPARLAKMLSEVGLLAVSAHVFWEAVRADPAAVIDTCEILGCDNAVIVGAPPEYRDPIGYKRFAHEACELSVTFRAAGIALGYHNHSFELQRFGVENGLELLLRETASADLNIQLDTYWLQHGGANPANWIRKVAGRAVSVHLKDMDVDFGMPTMTEVGSGNLDWPDILSACRETNLKWLIVEQDTHRYDPYESLATSLRNLSRLGVTNAQSSH